MPVRVARGFTLVELMVTLAVLAILAVLAVPSFNEFRQRAALRGAADQIASFWGDARFAALRENRLVKVGVVANGSDFCIGAAPTTSTTDDTACDCRPSATSNVCTLGRYPTDQREWRRVTLDGNPAWGDTDTDAQGVVVINPKRGDITEPTDVGVISLKGPPGGSQDYRLNVAVDRFGRAVVCEPSAAPSKLPQYTNRRC